MDRPGTVALTAAVAEEVCVRTESTAVLEGSIAALGSQYVLGLRAMACGSGDILAADQVQAARKEDVLGALTRIASTIRTQLGESLAAVEQHSTPLAEATTSSIDALKAYSAAWTVAFTKGPRRRSPCPACDRNRSRLRHGARLHGTVVRRHGRDRPLTTKYDESLRVARPRQRPGAALHHDELPAAGRRKPGKGARSGPLWARPILAMCARTGCCLAWTRNSVNMQSPSLKHKRRSTSTRTSRLGYLNLGWSLRIPRARRRRRRHDAASGRAQARSARTAGHAVLRRVPET